MQLRLHETDCQFRFAFGGGKPAGDRFDADLIRLGGDLQEMVGLHGVSFRVFGVRSGHERKDREGIHVHFLEPGTEAAHQA